MNNLNLIQLLENAGIDYKIENNKILAKKHLDKDYARVDNLPRKAILNYCNC